MNSNSSTATAYTSATNFSTPVSSAAPSYIGTVNTHRPRHHSAQINAHQSQDISITKLDFDLMVERMQHLENEVGVMRVWFILNNFSTVLG